MTVLGGDAAEQEVGVNVFLEHIDFLKTMEEKKISWWKISLDFLISAG